MSEIAVNNAAATIIAEIVASLKSLTISGDPLFLAVDQAGSQAEAEHKRIKEGPWIAVIFDAVAMQRERITDLGLGYVLSLDLFMGTKKNDAGERIAEALRLVAAVKNNFFTNQPSGAAGFAIDEEYSRIVWCEDETYDTASNIPWALAILPVRVSFIVTSETTH